MGCGVSTNKTNKEFSSENGSEKPATFKAITPSEVIQENDPNHVNATADSENVASPNDKVRSMLLESDSRVISLNETEPYTIQLHIVCRNLDKNAHHVVGVYCRSVFSQDFEYQDQTDVVPFTSHPVFVHTITISSAKNQFIKFCLFNSSEEDELKQEDLVAWSDDIDMHDLIKEQKNNVDDVCDLSCSLKHNDKVCGELVAKYGVEFHKQTNVEEQMPDEIPQQQQQSTADNDILVSKEDEFPIDTKKSPTQKDRIQQKLQRHEQIQAQVAQEKSQAELKRYRAEDKRKKIQEAKRRLQSRSKQILDALTPQLGVKYIDNPRDSHCKARGVLLVAVHPIQAAGVAGLEEDDVILSIDSTPTKNKQKFTRLINNMKAGGVHLFEFLRFNDSTPRKCLVNIGAQELSFAEVKDIKRLSDGDVLEADLALTLSNDE